MPTHVYANAQTVRRILCLLPFFLLLCWTVVARADVTLELQLKEGDKISDIASILAKADSNDSIEKVEFAVNDELRFTTGSLPYIYRWDTIADKEGSHTLSVTAIDSNGMKKTVTIKVVIDNELELGADKLATRALEALSRKDIVTAEKMSRRALKAEPDNTIGSRSLAAVFASNEKWDRAISILNKAKALDSSVPAMLELANYRIRRSLINEDTSKVAEDMASIYALRRKAADLSIAQIKAKNLPSNEPKTNMTLGDTYHEAGRWPEAIDQYLRISDSEGITARNRLALSYVHNDQPDLAVAALRLSVRDGRGDKASRAILGLAYLRQRKFADAVELVRNDTGNYPAAQIVAAYGMAAMKRKEEALKLASMAVAQVPQSGDAHYAHSMAIPKLKESEAAVVRALSLAPFQNGPIVDFATRIALLSYVPDRFQKGVDIANVALQNTPFDLSAKLVQATLLLQMKKVKESEPLLKDLLDRDKNGPDIHLAAAMYFDAISNPVEADRRAQAAAKIDPILFPTPPRPTPVEFLSNYVRTLHYRGGYFLSLNSLYPPTMEAKPTARTETNN